MAVQEIDSKTFKRIEELNSLDIELYRYAEELLQQRFKKLSSQDIHFREHFENMGKSKFSWADIEQEEWRMCVSTVILTLYVWDYVTNSIFLSVCKLGD